MNNVPNGGLPAYHQDGHPVHELIVGPTGPARARVVSDLITPSSWLIDVYGTHPDNVADWTARTLEAARDMLAQLNRARVGRGQGMCITIEDASVVLGDPQIRANLEDILRGASTAAIKFRLAVRDLTLGSFGDSQVIRDLTTAGNVIEAVSRG